MIDLVANLSQIRTALHQVTGDLKSLRVRGGILERAGVGRYGGEEAIGDRTRDRPAGGLEEAINQFPRGRLARCNPIQVAVLRVALVMVDVDERAAIPDAVADFAEALKAGAIGGNHAVEFEPTLRGLDQTLGIQEKKLLRNGIFVPAMDFLAEVLERQSETQLRADTVAIGPHVPDDAEGLTALDRRDDPFEDLPSRLPASEWSVQFHL